MAENDMVGADDHKTALEILTDSFLENIMQLFTFLLFVDHQFLLQLDLDIFNKNDTV